MEYVFRIGRANLFQCASANAERREDTSMLAIPRGRRIERFVASGYEKWSRVTKAANVTVE
jgi:hypothetical protein